MNNKPENIEIVHKPVMLKEVLSFIPKNASVAVDCTLGEGGHSQKMLDMGLSVYAVERDIEILEIAKNRLKNYKNFFAFNNTYNKLLDTLPKEIIGSVDFILFDLGISLYHFKKAGRGFSFNDEIKLNMKLGINETDAYQIVNNYSEKSLTDIFYKYGEMKNAKYMAKVIVENRRKKNIETSKELESIIFHASKKEDKYGRIHPATLIFQALRIETNDELNILENALKNINAVLKKNGTACVMSYHSLEDRIVKNYFKKNEKTKNKEGIFNILTKKVIVPSEEEIKLNPASRSCKMRVVEKR